MLVGIDLGGTKTEVIALSDRGKELFRHRVSTVKGNYKATIETITFLINLVRAKLPERVDQFGVAIPGSVSLKTGLIKNANSYWLIGHNLGEDLKLSTKCQKVFLENDANCFAISEATDGAGAGQSVVWGIILGTGSGSGIVINQKNLEGHNANGGEWGHNPLPWMDETEIKMSKSFKCFCHHQGCIESFVSGTGFEREYLRVSGKAINGSEIVDKMHQDDSLALEVFKTYASRLARSIAVFANFLDPDVIVLGGGMSNVSELYDCLPQLVQEYFFGGEFTTPIRRAMHGDSSGVRGAAWLSVR